MEREYTHHRYGTSTVWIIDGAAHVTTEDIRAILDRYDAHLAQSFIIVSPPALTGTDLSVDRLREINNKIQLRYPVHTPALAGPYWRRFERKRRSR